jgi:hypothetical protein
VCVCGGGGACERLLATLLPSLPRHSCLAARPRAAAHAACIHLEHLARALAVAGAEDGRVHILEASALEEGVRGVRQRAAHARDRANGVGARPQV